jgi:hypothetical protein
MEILENRRKLTLSEILGELSTVWELQRLERLRNPPPPAYTIIGVLGRGSTCVVYKAIMNPNYTDGGSWN